MRLSGLGKEREREPCSYLIPRIFQIKPNSARRPFAVTWLVVTSALTQWIVVWFYATSRSPREMGSIGYGVYPFHHTRASRLLFKRFWLNSKCCKKVAQFLISLFVPTCYSPCLFCFVSTNVKIATSQSRTVYPILHRSFFHLHSRGFSVRIRTQLLHLIFNFVRASPLLGRQLVETRGLLLFATALRNASPHHLTMELLTRLITAARNLIALIRSVTISGAPVQNTHQSYVFQLIRHLHGYMLCNPDVWIRAPLEVVLIVWLPVGSSVRPLM